MRRILLAALAAAGTLAVSASAVDAHVPGGIPVATAAAHHGPGLCARAYGVRRSVIRKHGARAPGRDICRLGVRSRFNSSWIRDATSAEKARYLRALRKLNAPEPAFLTGYAAPPTVPPAATMSVAYRPTGLAACIVRRESGGNPSAVNGQYHGIAQWSHEAWIRHGGGRFAPDPLGATYQQQLQVLSHALAVYGSGDWSAYDGCG